MAEIDIRIVRADSKAAQALIGALDEDIGARYPGMPVNGIDAEGFEAGGGVFAVLFCDGEEAACGAFRRFGEAAEIKRMFVRAGFRRHGLARRVLRFLEAEAARRGFSRAILETGNKQPEAIGLYVAEGWQPIPRYGQFVEDPRSCCFEKPLASSGAAT